MAVTSLLHYALEVPDVAVGMRFYRDFGLVDAGAGALRPAGMARAQVLLRPGPRKRLHHVAFGAPGSAFAAVRDRLARLGIATETRPEGGLWCHDADGNLVNVCDEEAPVPPPEAPARFNGPGGVARIGARAIDPARTLVAPRKLGHVLLFSPRIDAQLAFYRDALGLKLSDSVPGEIHFMRCSPDHHNLAFARSDRPGFHHASFEVGGVDEIALGAKRMQARGWKPAWGLGRHVIGSNFFHYIEDPWGSYAEYYFDLDHIPADTDWQPQDWAAEHALYLWGPDVPADFIVNKEA